MSKIVEALRRIGAHPRLEPGVALVLRGLTVRQSGRFIARELLRRRGEAAYRLRHGGRVALIRHGTPDVVTLGEVFHHPDYALPPEVETLLGGQPRVVDLGANIGLFGLWILAERPDAHVLSFEPDPANAAVLRQTIAINGLAERWELVEAAAGAADGDVAFESGRYSLSRVGERGDRIVPMMDALPELEGVHLVKMDIEGGEWVILGDPRFPGVAPPALVLEYHPHRAPRGVAPREAVERRLRECGYTLRPIVHRAGGHGMLWAWRVA